MNKYLQHIQAYKWLSSGMDFLLHLRLKETTKLSGQDFPSQHPKGRRNNFKDMFIYVHKCSKMFIHVHNHSLKPEKYKVKTRNNQVWTLNHPGLLGNDPDLYRRIELGRPNHPTNGGGHLCGQNPGAACPVVPSPKMVRIKHSTAWWRTQVWAFVVLTHALMPPWPLEG